MANWVVCDNNRAVNVDMMVLVASWPDTDPVPPGTVGQPTPNGKWSIGAIGRQGDKPGMPQALYVPFRSGLDEETAKATLRRVCEALANGTSVQKALDGG